MIAPVIAACGGGGLGATVNRAAFSSKEFGVTASPRVTTNPNPPMGGGRYQVGAEPMRVLAPDVDGDGTNRAVRTLDGETAAARVPRPGFPRQH